MYIRLEQGRSNHIPSLYKPFYNITQMDLNFYINREPTDSFYSSNKDITMKVLVTYLERNQVFSLSEKSTKGYLQDLKSQVSSYFKIADNRIIIIQRFDSEWDSFVDLDDDTDLHDRDKLKVVVTTDDHSSLTVTPDKGHVAEEVHNSNIN